MEHSAVQVTSDRISERTSEETTMTSDQSATIKYEMWRKEYL
jgi:hypothetical protein